LYAGTAGHRHRARLRPHHQCNRRGDHRPSRDGDAVLRHPQGAPGAARPQGRQGRRHRLQDRGARSRSREGPSPRTGARRRVVEGAVRVSLARSIRAVTGSRHRARIPRRDTSRRTRPDGTLLLDVRAEVLLDADHRRYSGIRRTTNGREVQGIRRTRKPDLPTLGDMTFLPLTPPGETPLRVMTIAGSDSGGGAGIQADLRTFALLGLHGLVAVTAVTVQNSVGVKGFHEIPLDVIAGQIEAVASDIGVQAAKTGMLASSAIIETIADTWRAQGLAGTVPLVVDP